MDGRSKQRKSRSDAALINPDSRAPAEVFNRGVAAKLRDTADVLETQGANPFRINAYRRAAQKLETMDADLRELIRQEGRDGLLRLPGIGQGLAVTIEEIVQTGRTVMLDRLRGEMQPESLFQAVPGIGPVFAERIHEHLHVDTLEALEVAAHDGRLEAVPGIGSRRAAAIRASLAARLGRSRPERSAANGPPVEVILDIDRRYRRSAKAGDLPKIAPRRFNPDHKAWLPILHADLAGWHFTALYSNTARAHELGRTHDWVVLYFYDGDHQEGQHTVVTETKGALIGERVVRGREEECVVYYRDLRRKSHGSH